MLALHDGICWESVCLANSGKHMLAATAGGKGKFTSEITACLASERQASWVDTVGAEIGGVWRGKRAAPLAANIRRRGRFAAAA